MFHGATGQAYLYKNAYNLLFGEQVIRNMTTGIKVLVHPILKLFFMGNIIKNYF
jgi:hypothetical protein